MVVSVLSKIVVDGRDKTAKVWRAPEVKDPPVQPNYMALNGTAFKLTTHHVLQTHPTRAVTPNRARAHQVLSEATAASRLHL